MQRKKPDSNLVKSWKSLNELITFTKERFLLFHYLDGDVTRYLSIKKYSTTRWIGLLLQAAKLLKVEKNVKERANQGSMKAIVDGID